EVFHHLADLAGRPAACDLRLVLRDGFRSGLRNRLLQGLKTLFRVARALLQRITRKNAVIRRSCSIGVLFDECSLDGFGELSLANQVSFPLVRGAQLKEGIISPAE